MRIIFLVILFFNIYFVRADEVSFNLVDQLIDELRLDEAEKQLKKIDKASFNYNYLKGKLAFYKGMYDEAYKIFSEIKEKDVISNCAINSYNLISRFKRYESRNFIIFYRDEKEEVYLPYLSEGLEDGLERLSKIFGFEPNEKIRVEILDKQNYLEDLTALPSEAIEKTNTIAVTKFNKIMMSSPRTQIEGYDYIGTAVHELIHFMISTVTYERTPVWIHESLARYFDNYSPQRLPELRPDTLSLLKKRYENKNLITFDQIHPSMALLPSQEDTAVAFAEVFLVSEFLFKRYGEAFVKSLLKMLKEKRSIDYIFNEFGYHSFKGFEDEFFRYLSKRIEKVHTGEHLYYKTTSKKTKKTEYMGDAIAMKYVKLGDLLFLENHYEAAYKEYEKASRSEPVNPHIENRKAFALINAKRFKEASEILEKITEVYPDYYSTFVNLARSYIAIKDYSKALKSLDRAIRINPFDKEIHLMFLKIFTEQNNQYEIDRFRRNIELLSRKN